MSTVAKSIQFAVNVKAGAVSGLLMKPAEAWALLSAATELDRVGQRLGIPAT